MSPCLPDTDRDLTVAETNILDILKEHVAEINILDILKELPEQIAKNFNRGAILRGYILFLKVSSHLPDMSLEICYKQFLSSYGRSHAQKIESFRKFFEFLQIRTFSEALCEVVSSVMKMSTVHQSQSGPGLKPVTIIVDDLWAAGH